ncbi:MAG TPA: LptF/LptG family permease [Gemmatimonadaceae bacterium]|nr:LptF/LptG family permease [Gemmatimonadaceae bacterium]
MKILHKYVLKEHVGPLGFALGALTSLLFLNQVAKRFGDLAGKGLPWSVIAEFFALAIPFIVAMTMPMAVLVATLYAFSRLASENEITALRASGVGMGRILTPVVIAAFGVTVVMTLFNDQVMPRANHRLAVLMRDIAQKKPTLSLRERVINEITPGRLYLRTNHLDEGSNRMREITIYDFADPSRRRTIFADSGDLAMSENQSDLLMTLHEGTLQDVPTDRAEQLQFLSFRTDRIRVRGVGNEFRKSESETYKGEREMTLCEMAAAQNNAQVEYARAVAEFREAMRRAAAAGVEPSNEAQVTKVRDPSGRTLGSTYCGVARVIGNGIDRARSALLGTPVRPREADARVPGAGVAAQEPGSETASPVTAQVSGIESLPAQDTAAAPAQPASIVPPGLRPQGKPGQLLDDTRVVLVPQIEDARLRLGDNYRLMSLYGVEIHKKLALAVACLVFVLLGAPIALRFPRGGVGLVIGVSIVVFGLYYVALIGGQALGVRGYVPPALAMWGANLLFGGVGVILLLRMGRETATSRGGDARELVETLRVWTAQQLARVGIRLDRRRGYQ